MDLPPVILAQVWSPRDSRLRAEEENGGRLWRSMPVPQRVYRRLASRHQLAAVQQLDEP